MTIRKGEDWGAPGTLPPDGVVVRSDAEARAVVERARRAADRVPPLGLLGGDLCRTLGGTGDEARLRSGSGFTAPVDLGSVLVDGRLHWFVAHLVVRRSWLRGPVFVAMNAQFLGRWDVAPRSHPGDGRLDTFDVTMGVGDRLKAWRRLPSGTHVPHPGIREQRTEATQLDVPRRASVFLDGVRLGPARALSIRVEPDELTIVV